MLCDACKKNEATYHTIQQWNGVKRETHLCAECRKKLLLSGADDMGGSFFSNIFSGFTGAYQPKKRAVCPSCGTTEDEFLRTGYLGCEHCYEHLRATVMPRVAKIQQGVTHIGKRPNSFGEEVKTASDEYASLKAQLKQAVDDEDYETAAKIKRKLQELREGAGGEVV